MTISAVLEDLTTNRSFRNAFPFSEALEKISSHSGSRYDPEVVEASLAYVIFPGTALIQFQVYTITIRVCALTSGCNVQRLDS